MNDNEIKINIEEILNKLNNEQLMLLTKAEYEIIHNDSELTKILLDKIKQGCEFNISDLTYYFYEELLFDKELCPIILKEFKNHDFSEFIQFYNTSIEEIEEELGPEVSKVFIGFLDEVFDETFAQILNADEELLSALTISNPRMIRKIINERIESLYGTIKMDTPTPEFEELLISALERNRYVKINTVNRNILDECIKTQQLSAAIKSIKHEDLEQFEILIEALKQGIISFSDLHYKVKEQINTNEIILRASLREKKLINIQLDEILDENFFDIIIDFIKENPEESNNYVFHNAIDVNEEFAFKLIKYGSIDNLKYFMRKYSSDFGKYANKNIEALNEAIIYNVECNLAELDGVFELLVDYMSYNGEIAELIYKDKTLFSYFVTKTTNSKYLNSLYFERYNPDYHRYDYIVPEYVTELFKNLNITFTELPKNFKFEVPYPDAIMLAIIQHLNIEQLDYNKIKMERFKDNPLILDAIFKRLKELKSNRFNSMMTSWDGIITPTMLEIMTEEENSLNLTSTQKLEICSMSKTPNEYFMKVLSTSDNLDSTTFILLKNKLYKEFNDVDSTKLLTMLFNPLKLEFSNSLMHNLISVLSNDYSDEQFLKFKKHLTKILHDYLSEIDNVPMILTVYLDSDTRKKSTYKDFTKLKDNPDMFLMKNNRNNSIPDDFYTFIDEAMAMNYPIDLQVIDYIVNNKRDYSYYSYPNITFTNNDTTINILTTLVQYNDDSPTVKEFLSKNVKKYLNYTIFDCQVHNKYINLAKAILDSRNSPYIDEVLKAISIENMGPTIVIAPDILTLLIKNYDNKELTERIHKTIITLLENDRIDKYYPDSNLSNYITIENPIFVDYLKKSFAGRIDSALQYTEVLLNSNIYHDTMMEILEKNPYKTLTNDSVLQQINNYPEVKQLVIKQISEKATSYLSFVKQFLDKDILKPYIENFGIDNVMEYILHNIFDENINIIPNESIQIIRENYLIKYPEYNKESFILLEGLYGNLIYRMLNTDNMKVLLKQEPSKIKKFIEIFKERSLDEGIISSINDSFKQNLFSLKNGHIINFYTNTLEKIQRGITDEEIMIVVNTLIDVIPKNLDETIEATNNVFLLELYRSGNTQEFLKQLIIELGNNQNVYCKVFNKITNNYILQKRNEYRKEQNIYRDTNLKYEIETRSLYNALFNYLIKNKPSFFNSIIIVWDDFLEPIEQTEININQLTFNFLTGQEVAPEHLAAAKKNIPAFKKLVFEKFERMVEIDKKRANEYFFYQSENRGPKFDNLPKCFEFLLEDEQFMKSVKLIPIYPQRTKCTKELPNINVEAILKYIDDQEKYEALIGLLTKYRFLEWGDLFTPVTGALSIGEDSNGIFNFINAFNSIYENEKRTILRNRKTLIDTKVNEKRAAGESEEEIQKFIEKKENEPLNISINAYKILKYSTIYSSISNSFKIILGLEDFELVKRNDGPNSSYESKEKRLEKTSELQIKMMGFDQVTIPSFIHEHECNENKKLSVIIGNRADSRNLTHGERTGACMRAYGHARDLFEFCNTDPRGFHFTFVDLTTNEYVSRVSGFRNGNTVFLNQLRNSVSSKFSDKDVVEACRSAALEIIERSKDSDMPIDNVVASPYFSLVGHSTQTLSESDIGKGVYTGYKDVTCNAVVLATTGNNGKAVPLKLDGEDQPVYKAVRLPVMEYTNGSVTESVKISMQRITSIKECMESDDPLYYKTIDFDYDIIANEFIHVFIGQNWYVSLDIQGNIRYDMAADDELSRTEMQEALDKINALKQETMEMGGFNHGIL